MIKGKFLAHDDFDLAGHRLLNWIWLKDLPTADASEGQVIAYVNGVPTWSTMTSSGIVSVAWDDITGKPATFPPDSHTHPWDQVTGKPATYPPSFHVHSFTGIDTNFQDTLRFFIGAALGDPVVDVTSDGTDITLSVTAASSPIVLLYHADLYDFDVDPAATIVLTEGTDAIPVLNYVWIPSDTQVLTKGLAWPTNIDYVPIATVLCQSAASVQTYGVYKMHAWTDHTHSDPGNGHLAHMNSWIRNQHATWQSGVGITATLGAAQFDIAVTAGIALQLHDHAYPAMTTVGGSEPLYVVNDNTTAYKRVANMVAELTDSAGGSLSGRSYNLVLWGVVSEDAADCKMMINLPGGSYANAASAQVDSLQYTDYGIPTDFKGCGFLIARLVVSHSPSGGGTFTLVETIDLRGSFPQGFGGSAGSGDHGGLAGLSDPDHPLTALQQSSATTNQAVVWNGSTWVADNVVNSVAAGTNITVSAASGTNISIATVSTPSFDTITLDSDLIHEGDPDTLLRLDTDQLVFKAGGVDVLVIQPSSISTSQSLTVNATVDADTLMVNGTVLRPVHLDGNGYATGNVPTWNATNSQFEAATPSTGGSTFTNVYVADDIIHVGDTDTKIAFNTDAISFYAGNDLCMRIDGASATYLWQAGTGPAIYVTATGQVDISGDLFLGATIYASEKIIHRADADTYWAMGTNEMSWTTGAETLLWLNNGSATAHFAAGPSKAFKITSAGIGDFTGDVYFGGEIFTAEGIVHRADVDNKIKFGTDTQAFEVAGSTVLDINGNTATVTADLDVTGDISSGGTINAATLTAEGFNIFPLRLASKTSDTSSSTTTLADDPHLEVAIDGIGWYQMDLLFFYKADATPDLKFQFNLADASSHGYLRNMDEAITVASYREDADVVLDGYGIGAPRMAVFTGIFFATASETKIKIKWAQNASDATASVLISGSNFRVRKLEA